MLNIFNREKNKEILNYVLAFAIPFISLVLICIVKRIYPFGDNCILKSDLLKQYWPFFTEFSNKLKSGSSLMHSWNLGLGSDFIALYAYYLASPLNWLLIVCPQELIIEFMTLLIIIKISLGGLSFYIFLKNTFKYEKELGIIALAFSYAYSFCGFATAYSINLMWLDGFALTPLILVGLRRLILDNKATLYYTTLALAIISNYYIGIIICIFVVLYFFVLIFENKVNFLNSLLRFTLFSLLAGLSAAFLILPEISTLKQTVATVSKTYVMEWYFGILSLIGRLCIFTEPYYGDCHWPNIYAGSFVILFICLYALNKQISFKHKVVRILLIVFFCLSFSNSYLDYAWHGLHFPIGFPARQSFLFTIVVLSICFKEILEFKGTEHIHLLDGLFLSAVVLFIGYISKNNYFTANESFYLTGFLIVLYSIALIVLKNNKNKKLSLYLLFVLVVSELFLNQFSRGFEVTKRNEILSDYDDYKEIIQLADQDSNGDFYRLESYEKMSQNDSSLYGYKGASIFSSLSNINVSFFNQSMFMTCGENFYAYDGATPLTSAMLSVDYLISNSAYLENDFRTLIGNKGNLYLYKNSYTLPVGYIIDDDIYNKIETIDETYDDGLNALAKALGATDSLVEKITCDEIAESGITTISIKEEGYYYASIVFNTVENLTIRTELEGIKTQTHAEQPFLIDLGYIKNNEDIYIANDNKIPLNFNVYKLNESSFAEAYKELSKQTITVNSYNDTYINLEINCTNAGKLVMPILNEEGWKLNIDGKQKELNSLKDTFFCFDIDEGVHTIELEYTTPYLKLGLMISTSSLLSFFIFNCFSRKNKRII